MTPAKRRVNPWVSIGLLALPVGLLVGWLVIGWWLWPVQWTSALPVDLGLLTRRNTSIWWPSRIS